MADPLPTDNPEVFKPAFADVVRQITRHGHEDPEAMMLIGSLAATLIDESGKKHWSAFKQTLDDDQRDTLRRSLKKQALNMAEAGHSKPTYAARILGVSLVAENLRSDQEVSSGIDLLDGVIDTTVRDFIKRMSEMAAAEGPPN